MRLRPTDYLGLPLSLLLAVGIFLTPSLAWAQAWTVVGSTGTVDPNNTGLISFQGPDALETGFQAVGAPPARIRYNIVAMPDLGPTVEGGIHMIVTYRATPDPIRVGFPANAVSVNLIQVNMKTGASTIEFTLNSTSFAPSDNFQSQELCVVGGGFQFDFANNVYYLDVHLGKKGGALASGVPGLRGVQLFAGCIT